MKNKYICLIVTILMGLFHVQVGFTAEIKSTDKKLLLTELIENILNRYVYKEQAIVIVKGLKELAATEHFENANDTQQLASMLTEKLESYDTHFNVSWVDPTLALPEQPLEETWESNSKRSNYGFNAVQHLTGNIGYLDLRFFDGSKDAKKRADATINYLQDSEVIIIDLRRNGGGSPEMVQYLSSYFFSPKNPIHLNSMYWREGEETTEFWTIKGLPAAYLPEIPVYILISPRTGSAAEEFAYNMRNLNRAILIGETTVGGANPGGTIPLSNHFSVFISTGASINPISQTNWEKVGVKPHIEIDSIGALNFAHKKALELVQKNTDNKWLRKEIDWKLSEMDAANQPQILSHDILNSIQGVYGNRKILLENGGLYYQNKNRMKQRMILISDAEFALADTSGVRLRFIDVQSIVGKKLELEMVSGTKLSFDKNISK